MAQLARRAHTHCDMAVFNWEGFRWRWAGRAGQLPPSEVGNTGIWLSALDPVLSREWLLSKGVCAYMHREYVELWISIVITVQV